MSDQDSAYYVVFEYTESAGAYAGNRFRTSYDSEASFAAAVHPDNLIVVGKGVTEAESLRLCEEVSPGNKVAATLYEAGLGTEHFDPEYAGLMIGLLMQRT